MSRKLETFTFTKVVELADADGKPIGEGSVLREIVDGERGVVARVMRPGDQGSIMDAVGDMKIRTGPGATRVSNRYDQWRHVPHDKQTYEERFLSWCYTPRDENCEELLYGADVSSDKRLAINGILSLLPSDDAVDWENGPHPRTVADALEYLSKHLTKITQPC